MGRNKKGYNWRARQNVSGNIDNSDTIKLASKIDVNDQQKVDIDSSNALVLPSKKRKFKATADTQPIGKILSKKKRKHLEKIVERKKKKEEREELVEKLQKVQADSELLNKMVSISAVQTKGLKRQFAENDWQERMEQSGVTLEQVIVNGDNTDDVEMPKRVKLKKPKKIREEILIDDPNVLGFEQSSSEDESEDDKDIAEQNVDSDKSELILNERGSTLKSDEKENLVETTIIKSTVSFQNELEISEQLIQSRCLGGLSGHGTPGFG